MTNTRTLLACLALFAFSVAAYAADSHETIKTKLAKLDADWSAAAKSHSVDKTLSYYADDAVVLAPNAPMMTGKANFRKVWESMLVPGNAVSWKASSIHVAKAGDMAYIIGSYEMTMNSSKGPSAQDKGKFLEIWKKQADGSWKCAVDAFNTDLPLAAQ